MDSEASVALQLRARRMLEAYLSDDEAAALLKLVPDRELPVADSWTTRSPRMLFCYLHGLSSLYALLLVPEPLRKRLEALRTTLPQTWDAQPDEFRLSRV